MDHCAPAIPNSHSGPKSAMTAHFILVRVNAHEVVSGAGTFSVGTVQTQRNIVSTHPHIISMVPRPLGESTQPSLASVPLDIEIIEEERARLELYKGLANKVGVQYVVVLNS